MKFIWIEILKFIKNNFIKLIIGTSIITALYMWRTAQEYNVEFDTIDDESIVTELKLNSEPAHFRLYIEYSDSSTFTNNLLIEQYITRPEVLNEASRTTSTNLAKIVEETENKAIVNYNETGETKVIGVTRDGTTNLHEFYVNVGNERDNLKIANFYYDYFNSGEISFLNDKTMYFIHDAKIKEYGDDITFNSPIQSTSRSIVKEVIIGVILGGIVSLGVIISASFLSKKLKYSFSYSLRESDYLYIINQKDDYQDELKQLLTTPKNNKYTVIHEGNDSNLNSFMTDLLNDENQNTSIQEVNGTLDMENPKQVDRLIYIVLENTTNRSWYNDQRILDRMYDIPTMIIQINK